MSTFKVDIKNKALFPPFEKLPRYGGPHIQFYRQNYDAVVEPRKHWCLLAEVAKIMTLFRPMYLVKDAAGSEFIVAFYTDDKFPQVLRECKVGDTMAIMYAHAHYFVDGKMGIRVEEAGAVKVIPCGLSTLVHVGEIMHTKSHECNACGKKGTSQRCAKCSARYCGRECQMADWKRKHRAECRAGQQILQWRKFDWKYFDGYKY